MTERQVAQPAAETVAPGSLIIRPAAFIPEARGGRLRVCYDILMLITHTDFPFVRFFITLQGHKARCPRSMKRASLILTFLLLSLLPTAATAEVWTAERFPIPYLQDMTRHVSDPDGLLTTEARDSIDMILTAMQSERGVQSIVAVARRIEDGDAYSFGMALARKYGVGRRKQNSGLVIVLSTEDRAYYILTGTGLEGTLPDAICKRIENRYMVPALKRGDWDTALLSSVRAISACVSGDTSLVAESDESDDDAPVVALFIVIFGLFILFVIIASRNSRATRCPRCGAHAMKPTGETVRRTADGEEMIVVRCSKCGYTETRRKRGGDDNGGDGLSALWPIIFLGGTGRSGFGGGFGGGGGFSGGSFGGGSFGGGGAGGRF